MLDIKVNTDGDAAHLRLTLVDPKVITHIVMKEA